MNKFRFFVMMTAACILLPNTGAIAAKPAYTEIAQPKTDIIGEITLSSKIESKADLDRITASEQKPACVIVNVTADGKAADSARTLPFASLDEIITALNGVIMPAFYVTNENEAQALTDFLKSSKFEDAFVISSVPKLVYNVRNKVKTSRGIIDFTDAYKDKTEISEDELMSVRGIANANYASTVILPSSVADRDTVKFITDRLLTVWVNEVPALTSVTQAYRLISSGPHGIISDNTELLLKVATEYLGTQSLIRTPLNIGHRGMPSRAPENTLEGALLAYEAGADVIEIDIYLTTDNELAVIHDATTERTCDKNLNVESSSMAELKELYVNKGFENDEAFKNCRIPSIRDYYEAFKDKDVQIFVEIKSTKPAIVNRLKEITEEYQMEDQISVITFHTSQIKRVKTQFPTMSVGYLTGDLTGEGTGAEKAGNVLSQIQRWGSTYNPSYPGLTESYVENANMRGLTTWPWTVNTESDYKNLFFSGFNGITTNHAYFAENYPKFVDCEQYEYNLQPGQTHTVSATVTTYGRQTSELFKNGDKKSKIIVLEGGENVDINGSQISFKSDNCTFTYAVEYEYSKRKDVTFTVYSQPVTVTVASQTGTEETSASTDTQLDSSATTNSTDTENNGSNLAVPLVISAAAVAAVAVTAAVILKKKKQSE